MLRNYRPGPGDFHIEGQKLSCREGGKADWNARVTFTNPFTGTKEKLRAPVTLAEQICLDRDIRGISRRHRINRTGVFANETKNT